MNRNVPYLREEQIESDATVLLAEYARARGVVIEAPIPIEDIIEKYLKLGIEFNDMHRLLRVPRSGLGFDPDVLGAIYFDERRIVIDESLDPEENPSREGRYRFTLAHEGGGHWRLHRHLFAKDPGQVSLFNEPTPPSVVCRTTQGKEPVEWQADFYASCLLMPRTLVLDAWKSEFGSADPFVFQADVHLEASIPRTRDGPRPIGEIIRQMQRPAIDDAFDAVAFRFSAHFGVSVQAMRIRLEKLRLLRRDKLGQLLISGIV